MEIRKEIKQINCYAGQNRPAWINQNGNAIDSGDTTTPAQRINVYMDNGKVDDFYRNLAKGSLRVVKVCD